MQIQRTPEPLFCGEHDNPSEIFQRMENRGVFAFDTETTGLHITKDSVVFWSVSDGDTRWCLTRNHLQQAAPLFANPRVHKIGHNVKYDMHMLANSGVSDFRGLFFDTRIAEWLRDENLKGQLGLKECCSRHGILANARSFKETFSEWIYTEEIVPAPTKKDPFKVKVKKVENKNFGEVLMKADLSIVSDYASLDSWMTFRLFESISRELEATPCPPYFKNLLDYYIKFEADFTSILWRMERRGFQIDVDYLNRMTPFLQEKIQKMDVEIASYANDAGRYFNQTAPQRIEQAYQELLHHCMTLDSMPSMGTRGRHQAYQKGVLLGEMCQSLKELYPIQIPWDFNPGSVKQLSSLLYTILNLPVEVRTDKGAPSTDSEALGLLANKPEGKIAAFILESRDASKLYGTYVKGILEKVGPDNRIRGTVNQDGTVSGRFSMSDPSLQTMPRPKDGEFEIREAFVAAPGKILIAADYDQLEMRIMAHFSKDPILLDAIMTGKDLHCMTASRFAGCSYDEAVAAKKKQKTDPHNLTVFEKDLLQKRQDAKITGYGILYGIGGYGLSKQLSNPKEGIYVTPKEASMKIEQYFSVYKGVKKFIDDVHAGTMEHLFLTTLLGRRRRLTEMGSNERHVVNRAKRQAPNSVIQGTAADIAKAAMAKCEYDEYLVSNDVRQLVQVHDEIVFEAPETVDIEQTKNVISYNMANCLPEPLLVPLTVGINHGRSWAEAK